MSNTQPASRVGKIREDAYFNDLDQVLLADLRDLMIQTGEAVSFDEQSKSNQDENAEVRVSAPAAS
jgi:hypothetical protein